MKTYYDVLEVSSKAGTEVINRAHKVLVKKYHPDLQLDEQSKKEAAQKMIEINAAYEVLSDENKRAKYDAELKREEEIAKQKELEKMQRNSQVRYSTKSDNNTHLNVQDNSSDNVVGYNNAEDMQNYQNEFYKMAYETERKRQQMLRDMEIEHYRRMGYKIVYPVTMREMITRAIIILVFLVIFIAMFNIPFFDNQVHEFFKENTFTEGIYRLLKNIFTFKWLGG
ncbi:MAG: J domain-containing protein [Clostridium sp.]